MAHIAQSVGTDSGENTAASRLIVPALVAGTGGMLPTLSRLAATYVDNPHTPEPAYGIYLGLAIFFLIGAILAFAFGEKSLRQALIIGISAPALINSIASGLKDAQNAPRPGPVSPAGEEQLVDPETLAPIDSNTWNFSIGGTAYAQTTLDPTGETEALRDRIPDDARVLAGPLDSEAEEGGGDPDVTNLRIVSQDGTRAALDSGMAAAPISRESIFGERRVDFHLSFDGTEKRNETPIRASFFDEGGYRVGQRLEMQPSAMGTISTRAPVSARGLLFDFGGVKKSVKLPQDSFRSVAYNLSGSVAPGNDLSWSFGYSRALVKVQAFDVKQGEVVAPAPVAEQIRSRQDGRIFGIDASHFQKSIDWPKLHQGGIRFAILRATYGVTRDRKVTEFKEGYNGFEARDEIALGFYHFFRFGQAPEEQAEAFLSASSGANPARKLPPAVGLARNIYDTEITPETRDAYFDAVRRFLGIVENQTGRTVTLFINKDIVNEVGLPADLAARPLWIKDFENSMPLLPEGADDYRLWLLGTARLPGIDSVVDLNIFNGSQENFESFARATQM